ncbi:hypothetical protein Y1Q_0023153 [Alligator mississippiensis]|uniref:Uncharacterized protein n=1 Tax=Alligator mississippiensis TaxID=8496 RepID=A0A151MZE7_ALLMI|nr:hypothetical protein Y1Q_0023153 [Alligator mississippiensis]
MASLVPMLKRRLKQHSLAGAGGQLQQGDGQLRLSREEEPHGGGLLVQVQVELVEELLEGDPGHLEQLQPPIIILGVLEDVQPPVLAGPVGLQAAGLEPQELKGSTSGGIQEHNVIIPAGVQVQHGAWMTAE